MKIDLLLSLIKQKIFFKFKFVFNFKKQWGTFIGSNFKMDEA